MRHPGLHQHEFKEIMKTWNDNHFCQSEGYQWTEWRSETTPRQNEGLDIELLIHHQQLFKYIIQL